MLPSLKHWFVGNPLPNEQLAHERLSKRIALAVFSSDALSSSAYATEAILIALAVAGPLALGYALPISIAIALLLITVSFSYRQTIMAYPQGGGTYIVSRENLGTKPALLAASALLIDYTLTVAVSMSAAVAAISSAVHALEPYRIELAIALIALITMANLRGMKEAGSLFAIPTYLFVISMFLMISVGLWKIATNQVTPVAPPEVSPFPSELHLLTPFLLLRAFAAGCTALTGIEAIADGVPAFRKPESRNASITLVIMVVLLCGLFLGITTLANAYQVIPDGAIEHETANSQLARAVFGSNTILYFVLQISTMLILVLASNTAFADFPRLASFLANDRFLPRQFSQRGDRLVFSNGIIVLAVIAALLVIAFRAKEQALLPLYAVGVFISFTLSQLGMVMHHRKEREANWQRNMLISGSGALVTFVVLIILAITKFLDGAWAILALLPIMMLVLQAIHRHYVNLAAELSLSDAPHPVAVRRHTVVVLISSVHRGVIPALQYGLSLTPDNITAVHVQLDEDKTDKLRAKWEQWGSGIPLVILPSPYRSLSRPLMQYIDKLEQQYDDDVMTIIVPEFVPSRWWQYLLHNQTALLIKAMLLFKRGKVVTSVPYHLHD